MENVEGELMDEKEAAAILKVSVFFMRNRRHIGGGPTYIKMGGSVRYHPRDLADFVEKSRRVSTSPSPKTEKEIGK